jgi:hypothetical protein
MSTKLTLTIDDLIIEKAKQYAKFKGYSLSGMIENYLKIVIAESDKKGTDIEITPIVKSLMGTFKAPKDFDYKKELSKSLSNKYL